MSTVKSQHYIPQSYLKRFGTNEKIDVLKIETQEILEKQSTKSYACINYFYDIDPKEIEPYFEDLFKFRPHLRGSPVINDPQYIEHYFSRLEGDIKKIFDDLEQNHSLIKDISIQSKLIIFLHDLSIRTETIRKENISINKTIYDKLKDTFPIESLWQFTDIEAKKKQIRSVIELKPLLRTMQMLTENYKWYIGINNSKNIDFIISDNPALDILLGFNDICIPISKKHALIFKIKNKKAPVLTNDKHHKSRMYLTEKSVLIYNSHQFIQGDRFIFGDKKSIELTKNFIHELKKIQK